MYPKSHWNYRIIDHINEKRKEAKKKDASPMFKQCWLKDNEHCYAIHEVYYENGKPQSWPISPEIFDRYETKEEMLKTYNLIGDAFLKPILKVIYKNGKETLKEVR